MIRTSLARLPSPATDRDTLRAWAVEAYTKGGPIILWPEDIADDWDRQHVVNVARKLYGRRAGV